MTKACFFISPIGEEGSEVRQRADEVFETVVKKVCRGLDYKIERADELSRPGDITEQIAGRLLQDDLVIADLSGHNPNVFYELAVRHAIEKPIIHIIEKSQHIPFDVSGFRTIKYSMETGKEGIEFTEALSKQIQDVEQHTDTFKSPLSGVITLRELKKSDNPVDQSNAAILEGIQELSAQVSSIIENSDVRAKIQRLDRLPLDAYREAIKLPPLFAELQDRFVEKYGEDVQILGSLQSIMAIVKDIMKQSNIPEESMKRYLARMDKVIYSSPLPPEEDLPF